MYKGARMVRAEVALHEYSNVLAIELIDNNFETRNVTKFKLKPKAKDLEIESERYLRQTNLKRKGKNNQYK